MPDRTKASIDLRWRGAGSRVERVARDLVKRRDRVGGARRGGGGPVRGPDRLDLTRSRPGHLLRRRDQRRRVHQAGCLVEAAVLHNRPGGRPRGLRRRFGRARTGVLLRAARTPGRFVGLLDRASLLANTAPYMNAPTTL